MREPIINCPHCGGAFRRPGKPEHEMKVIRHWIDGATRIKYPKGPPMNIRRCAVIHFTAGARAMSSIDFWRTPAARGAEAHIVIERDGTLYQIRATNQKADHAGGRTRSRWVDPNTGKKYFGLNSISIGIELANGGDAFPTKFSDLSKFTAKHPNGGAAKDWERYPDVQIETLIVVCLALCERYNLDDITGHENIAPERKNDPGPAFPMERVRKSCGFEGLPVTHWK